MFLLAALALSAAIDVVPPTGYPTASSPSLAIDRRGTAYVAFGQGSSIYVSSSDDLKQFSKPVKIAEVGALALGMRRGPRIAISGKTIAVSAVAGRQGRGKDENLYVWASTDRGVTWKGPAQVNDVAASAREGLHGMAGGSSFFACTWLDLREKGTRLMMSTSPDGMTWGDNVEVYRSPDGSICECCHPSIAIDNMGSPTVMFRNSLGGNRDMYIVRARNARSFNAAQKLGRGAWELGACPMDGGALALDSGGDPYSVWRRGDSVYSCKVGEEEKMLGKGQNPWMVLRPVGPVYAWISEGRLMLLEPGATSAKVVSEKANDPVMAVAPDGWVVLAWTDLTGGSRIKAMKLGGV